MDSKGSTLSPIAVVDRAADRLVLIDATGPTNGANTVNSVLGIASAPLGTTDTQSPTNKTFDNSNIFTVRDDRFTIQDNADTTKQAVFQASGITTATTRTYTLPDRSSTLATLGGNQTFTGVNTIPGAILDQATITRPTLQTDSISEYTAAAGVTIDGLLIKDGLLPAGNIQPLNLTSGTGSSWSWQSWAPTYTNIDPAKVTTQYSKYLQIGKNVFFRIQFNFTNTTPVSGLMGFSLPVTANAETNDANDWPLVSGQLSDATGSRWNTAVTFGTTTRLDIYYWNASANLANTSSTAPFTWTTSDLIVMTGMYEAA